jgi:hypothetical protein
MHPSRGPLAQYQLWPAALLVLHCTGLYLLDVLRDRRPLLYSRPAHAADASPLLRAHTVLFFTGAHLRPPRWCPADSTRCSVCGADNDCYLHFLHVILSAGVPVARNEGRGEKNGCRSDHDVISLLMTTVKFCFIFTLS